MERPAKIERRAGLSEATFVADYLVPNKPIIVTDAMESWAGRSKWTPAFFLREFGQEEVQVYDHLFDLIDMTSLADYLGRNFGKPEGEESAEYVRWYSMLKDIDFLWSDEVFARLSDDWKQPAFLPDSDYVVPFCPAPATISVTGCRFPYKGLFFSGKGARTRLHRDPFGSEAILCQVHGRKHFAFYPPQDDDYVRAGTAFVDPRAPDRAIFPNFDKARPVFEDVLAPGEIVFIPDGWFHDVMSLDDSISITWNFVHRARAAPFARILAESPQDREVDVVRFFLADQIAAGANVADILSNLGLAPAQSTMENAG
jgi:hypothetical protein